MTVAELIEKLQELPQDIPVLIWDEDTGSTRDPDVFPDLDASSPDVHL
jgi:hypothetical protein